MREKSPSTNATGNARPRVETAERPRCFPGASRVLPPPPPHVRQGRRRLWKKAFLAAYVRTGNVAAAARVVGIHGSTVSHARRRDPFLDQRMHEAESRYLAALEMEVDRRAIQGHDEPIYQGGVLVGYRKVYSDRLAELRLKRLDPAYRDKQRAPAAALDPGGPGLVLQMVYPGDPATGLPPVMVRELPAPPTGPPFDDTLTLGRPGRDGDPELIAATPSWLCPGET